MLCGRVSEPRLAACLRGVRGSPFATVSALFPNRSLRLSAPAGTGVLETWPGYPLGGCPSYSPLAGWSRSCFGAGATAWPAES